MTLEVAGLTAHYGPVQALHGVDLIVEPNMTVAVIVPNGAGKSTLLASIAGLVESDGDIRLDGTDLRRLPPHRRIGSGIGYVPDTRGVFTNLTVRENLAASSPRGRVLEMWEELSAVFPLLKEKEDSLAGQLSGGQQQLVSIARALASRPRYILLDEPSIGLSPVAIQGVVDALGRLEELDVGVLMAEQNSSLALRVADYCHVLSRGRIVFSGPPDELRDPERLGALYLGQAGA